MKLSRSEEEILAEAEELDRMIREEAREELKEKIFHPIRYRKKHKDDHFLEKHQHIGMGM